MTWIKPDISKWTGRSSVKKEYYHELISCGDINNLSRPEKATCAILGYASDKGVERNQGRIGAKLGPDEIRNRLAKISNHPGLFQNLTDMGDIRCEGDQLEEAHDELSHAVRSLLANGYFPILLGGGHDIAYGHYRGIRQHVSDSRIGIINLDAHFDLRKPDPKRNSGTPFFQIAEECRLSGHEFRYMCLGVQPLSNSRTLYETAEKFGVKYISAKDFNRNNLKMVVQRLKDFASQADYLYLTIDMDGFCMSLSPGVSAPSPFGFHTDIVLSVIDLLMSTGKVISLDIAETNPVYDVDGHTSRLAASLIGYVLSFHSGPDLPQALRGV